MPRPRKYLVAVEDTPYYHVVSRCVRRAFLCGTDAITGQSYEHRRYWIEERIRLLASIFSIDICAYAVMSNHFHIVVKLNPEESNTWSDDEVCKRWASLFAGPELLQRRNASDVLSEHEQLQLQRLINEYRSRLGSLSWFMKCLNEPIARAANKEDNCTGHFWEGRFKSQALLTEKALLSCMVYVDLNPIRAAMAETPESSDHTSIKERLKPSFTSSDARDISMKKHDFKSNDFKLKPLLHFNTGKSETGIPFDFNDYLELVDFTGRATRNNKRGFIPRDTPPILERLNINSRKWLEEATNFERLYRARFSNSIPSAA